jgi:hypothetical protein
MFRSIGLPELIVICVFAFIFLLWPYCKIFSKAGYPGALGVLMLVPLLNVVMLFFLAFSDWPILRKLRALQPNPNA